MTVDRLQDFFVVDVSTKCIRDLLIDQKSGCVESQINLMAHKTVSGAETNSPE